MLFLQIFKMGPSFGEKFKGDKMKKINGPNVLYILHDLPCPIHPKWALYTRGPSRLRPSCRPPCNVLGPLPQGLWG
jgi:hypothetical protein